MEFTNDCMYAKAVANYEVSEAVKNLIDTNDVAERVYYRYQRNVECYIEKLAFDYDVEESVILDAIRSDAFMEAIRTN